MLWTVLTFLVWIFAIFGNGRCFGAENRVRDCPRHDVSCPFSLNQDCSRIELLRLSIKLLFDGLNMFADEPEPLLGLLCNNLTLAGTLLLLLLGWTLAVLTTYAGTQIGLGIVVVAATRQSNFPYLCCPQSAYWQLGDIGCLVAAGARLLAHTKVLTREVTGSTPVR